MEDDSEEEYFYPLSNKTLVSIDTSCVYQCDRCLKYIKLNDMIKCNFCGFRIINKCKSKIKKNINVYVAR